MTGLFLPRTPKAASGRKPSERCHRPNLEALEDRLVPYSLSGFQWANPNVSASFVPDGTLIDGYSSTLFSQLNAVAPTATWQGEFARALQTWAQYVPLNFHFVSDDGSPKATFGLVQGDSRFGDIRLGTRVLSSSVLGYAHYPNVGTTGSTEGGDIALNSTRTYYVGSQPDLYSVLLHESGHALGLGHSTSGTVMYGAITGIYSNLTADDIAGIQAIYGVRPHDVYDAAASNNSLGAATTMALSSGGVRFQADLTSQADVDYYRVVASGSSLTVSVDARNLSLLAPRVLVYDAGGNLMGSASGSYGTVTTLTLSGLVAGQTYYLVADGATSDVFGMGAYVLDAQFSGGSISPPQAPSSLTATATSANQVNLVWQDNASNEDGFRIERSTDGTNFTFVATVGANVTSYAVTGLSASTTYSFRVRAYNGAGDSVWSNTAQATTQPASTLNPDRYEVNDTMATARDLGRFNSTSQTGLTIHSTTDGDFFVFTANTRGNFRVSITFAHALGNLDLYVYDAQQRLLASSIATVNNEAVSVTLADGQRYYVKVVSPDGGMNTYDLTVTKISGKGGGGAAALLPGSEEETPAATKKAVSGRPLGGCGCPLCASAASGSSSSSASADVKVQQIDSLFATVSAIALKDDPRTFVGLELLRLFGALDPRDNARRWWE